MVKKPKTTETICSGLALKPLLRITSVTSAAKEESEYEYETAPENLDKHNEGGAQTLTSKCKDDIVRRRHHSCIEQLQCLIKVVDFSKEGHND